MKRIASIIFAMFMGIALAIGGGVLLLNNFKNINEPESEKLISVSSTSPAINRLLTTNFNGVDISFNESRSILTLNGSYANNGNVGYILETETFNVTSGDVIGLKIEFVNGSYSGGGRVVFMWDLLDSSGNLIQRSTGEPNISNDSDYYLNTLDVSASSAHFQIALWRNIELNGTPKFENAKYRLSFVYGGKSTSRDYVVTYDANGGDINYFEKLPNMGSASNKLETYGTGMTYYIADNNIYIESVTTGDHDMDHYGYLDLWVYLYTGKRYTFSLKAVSTNPAVLNSNIDAGFFPEGGGTYYFVEGADVTSTTIPTEFRFSFTPNSTQRFQLRLDSEFNNAKYRIYDVSLTCSDGNCGRVVKYNSTYVDMPTPTKMYYTFSGWKTNLASAGEYFDRDAVSRGNYLPNYYNGYWSHPNLIEFSNNSGSTLRVDTNYIVDAIYCYDRQGKYIAIAGDFTKVHNIPNGTYYIRFENNASYLSYANKDALKAICDSKTIDSTTTVNISHDHTLIASWTPNKISNTVHLRIINPDGSYIDEGNNSGGTVKVEGYQVSGSDSVFMQLENAHSGKTYSVHQGQQFRLTATANDGYVFAGFSKSGSPSDAIKFPSSPPSNVYSDSPSSGTNYYVYFKKISDNTLQYDETDKYFYFEDGYYPQSDANKLRNVEGFIGEFADVNFAYDVNSNVVTLDGAYSGDDHVKEIMTTETISNIKTGRKVKLNVEFLGGSVTGGGRVVFGWLLYDSNGTGVQNCGTVPSITDRDTEFSDTISSNVSSGYFKVYVWRNVDDGGAPTYENAKFRVTISYDITDDLNASATSTGEIIYNDGKKDESIPVYSYNGDKFAKVVKSGTSAWFKFEPIRWRISDYGVEKTERNISRYQTLLQFKNYTSYSPYFVAVSDLILGVGAMHNTRNVREGDSVAGMAGFQNIKNITNGMDLQVHYNCTNDIITIDNYSDYDQGNTVIHDGDFYEEPLRICSTGEIEEVGLINRGARASDMVAFILGLDKDQVSYWTRDLSNLGAGVAITPTGTVVRPWLDEVLGMRFAYTFREGSNASFYT